MENSIQLISNLKKDIINCGIKTKAGEICIKIISMNTPISVEAINIVFSDEEKQKFMKISSTKRRREIYFGRFMAKLAAFELSGIKDYHLHEISIVKGLFHNPLIIGKISNCAVSISHSKDYVAVVAFPKTLMIGLDIETIDYENRSGICQNISENEGDIMTSGIGKELFSLILWTCKEALGKCIGLGLSVNYAIYDIDSMEVCQLGYRSTFANFPELIAYTTVLMGYLISIVYPRKIEIENKTSIISGN